MRKTIYIFLLLISYTAYSQSFSIFDIDASSFPAIKASFFAFDADGKQITNLNPSDFEVKENGQTRKVTSVICNELKPIQKLSIVFAVDVTVYNDLKNAKSVLLTWLDMIQLGTNEAALMTYHGDSYINQDFTKDKSKLTSAINSLKTLTSTENHTGALVRPSTGALSIAQNAKYKPIVIVLSSCSHYNQERKAEIIVKARKNNISVNFVIFDRYDWTPEICSLIAKVTGGIANNKIPYYDVEKAKASINNILLNAQGAEFCQMEWQSVYTCEPIMNDLEILCIPKNLTVNRFYKSPTNSVTKLEQIPQYIKFLKAIPGIMKDTTVTVTARNADFNVTNITSSNPSYIISPKSFFLKTGQSQELTVSYVPSDSGYTYTKFTFFNDKCSTNYYASGGFPGIKPKIQTLKIIQPNGGESFVVGMDTLITWEGVLPNERVKIEYTTNNGTDWILITNKAKDLAYKWVVPKTPSNKCLARVISNPKYDPGCADVAIGNQIWMGCNLDVDTYRDGTPIPEVKDPKEWVNLKTGAWCYCDYNPELREIYRKLYNWYAVNDSRGLAPEGWHIATDSELTELINFLGGESVAGGKLKSTGYWSIPNTGATNETGFSALPGGCRDERGNANALWLYCLLWSSTEYNASDAYFRGLRYNNTDIYRNKYFKECGFSVRCVKD